MKALFTVRGLLTVWLPIVAISAIHYLSPPDVHWVHDVARRLFYIPVLLAGGQGGLRGGLFVGGVVVAIYAPHAFWAHIGHDPATHTEKLLEMVFYCVIGGVSGYVVERQQRAQRELTAKDEQLARAARLEALGQLAAGLAHEIRNPLHAMRGTAEILLDAVPVEAPEHELGRGLMGEIDRLTRVLQRFLDFARHGEPRRDRVPLDDVVQRVGELVRAQAGRQDTRVVVDRGGAVVEGDADQLTQVVLALALNALQALGSGGTVWLEARGPSLRVCNDGPPVPEEVRQRLFDPFFTTRPEGTGLGLSVAWRIVQDHGGDITVSSHEGRVVFEVAL